MRIGLLRMHVQKATLGLMASVCPCLKARLPTRPEYVHCCFKAPEMLSSAEAMLAPQWLCVVLMLSKYLQWVPLEAL